MVTATIAPSKMSGWVDTMADFESDSMSARRAATAILGPSRSTSAGGGHPSAKMIKRVFSWTFLGAYLAVTIFVLMQLR